MPTESQIQQAINAGYTPQQIKLAIAKSGATQRASTAPSGVRGWLTDGNRGLRGAASAVGNVLNLPSYAIGGMLNQGQRAFGSKYGQETDATGLGVLEGIKNKRAVFTEAPETFGVDPNSKLGMGIGFAGELLTPDIPLVGMAGDAFKASKATRGIGKVSNKGISKLGKIGDVTDDAARVLLEKSYKLSASDIKKLAKSIGVTDESQKAIKVVDYLEGLGLKGSNRGSLKTLNKVADKTQNKFNKLTRTGGAVSRQPYIDNLLNEAIKAEKLDTPQSRRLAEQLFKEAEAQSLKIGKPLTDTDLTNRISKLFDESSNSALSNPLSSNLSKRMAIAGQDAREILRPGATKMGRNLRGLRTAQDVVGAKANTGLGTQLINSFKPSGAGFGFGAVAGYSSGRNPLETGLLGGLGGMAINNPRVMNTMGKFLQKGVSLPSMPKVASPVAKTALRIAKKTPKTAFRVGTASSATKSRQAKQSKTSQKLQKFQSYKPSISQRENVFKNKSAFGKNFKLKKGAFN